MLGKRTIAAIVALMLILGMGATTLVALLPQQSPDSPMLTAEMAPTVEQAWGGDSAAAGALPAAVTQNIAVARAQLEGQGYEVGRAYVNLRPLANEAWELHTTLDLNGPDGPTQVAWVEYYRGERGVTVAVPQGEVIA